MMEVDRCDIIKLTPEGELRISHEWRAPNDVPSSLDTRIPVDAATLADAPGRQKTNPAGRHFGA